MEFEDYDGRILQNPQYIIDGQAASSPSGPKREGHTFTGWNKKFYRVMQSMKIQASYQEGVYITCPVYFYGKIAGSSSWHLLKTEYVPVGESAHPPMLPVYSGYNFREWPGNYTNIRVAQSVYAQYDKAPGEERTYTVQFWSGGKVIKTEIVPEGGNATPPSALKLKGYSFAGWDKSYVNIGTQTMGRSRAGGVVDITALYQVTAYLQKFMSLEQFSEVLAGMQLPAAVETTIYAFGASVACPFDGVVLDVLAAVALVGTICYNWDDIKDNWEDIEAAIRAFAGTDAGNEVIENIEEGLDEAGKDSDAIAIGLSGIAGQYGLFKCKEAANAMAEYLKKQKQEFKFITMYYPSGGTIISLTREAIYGLDSKESRISENGYHYGIEYNGIVFCNVHPLGLPRNFWEADFWGIDQANRIITPK